MMKKLFNWKVLIIVLLLLVSNGCSVSRNPLYDDCERVSNLDMPLLKWYINHDARLSPEEREIMLWSGNLLIEETRNYDSKRKNLIDKVKGIFSSIFGLFGG